MSESSAEAEGQQPDPTAWGQSILPTRKAELADLHARQKEWVGQLVDIRGDSIFKGIELTGADVFWLAEQVKGKFEFAHDLHLEDAYLSFADLNGSNLSEAHLEGANFVKTHLDGANLCEAHLEGANFSEAHLKNADLRHTYLEGTSLSEAYLESADLSHARLVGADLRKARLEGANLTEAHLKGAELSQAHLKGATLSNAHLEGTSFTSANLEGVDLSNSHLVGANFSEAHLEDARLSSAQLGGANFTSAHLKRADLRSTHLERAFLGHAQLEGANFSYAQLEGANLSGAHLEGANLFGARLEGADLSGAQLSGTSLVGSWLTSSTVLATAVLDDKTRLGDIHWSGVGAVDLTQLNWEAVPTLGDESGVGLRAKSDSHAAVVRAYRQLAAQLRAQGITDVADRFSYRAQIRQRYLYLRTLLEDWRRPWRLPGDLLRYFGSFSLALLAGYGYRPGRTIVLYFLFITLFAALYFAYGTGCHIAGLRDIALILAQQIPHGYACVTPPDQPMTWNEAFVVSFTAFHGRGFLATSIKPGDPQAAIAAAEAVLGLIIEISFIATFTQRFFGAK